MNSQAWKSQNILTIRVFAIKKSLPDLPVNTAPLENFRYLANFYP